jgi:hypothetical protein
VTQRSGPHVPRTGSPARSELLPNGAGAFKGRTSARGVRLACRYGLPASPGCDRLGVAESSVDELLVAPHSW